MNMYKGLLCVGLASFIGAGLYAFERKYEPVILTEVTSLQLALNDLRAARDQKKSIDKIKEERDKVLSLIQSYYSGKYTKGGINDVDNDGWTLLMRVAQAGDPDVIKDVLNRGGDPKIVDKAGGTALTKAAAAGNQEAVEVLLPVSDMYVVMNNGKTVLDVATPAIREYIVSSLRSPGQRAAIKGTTPADAARP